MIWTFFTVKLTETLVFSSSSSFTPFYNAHRQKSWWMNMEANEQWWHRCPSKMLSFLPPWKSLLLQNTRVTQLGTICVHALNLHANSFSQSIPTPKLLSQWAHILVPSTKKNYVQLNCYILKNIEHGALLVCRGGTSAISNPQRYLNNTLWGYELVKCQKKCRKVLKDTINQYWHQLSTNRCCFNMSSPQVEVHMRNPQ